MNKADPPILFVRPKAVSEADKAKLAKAGVIVVEVPDPTAIKFMRAGYELSHSNLLSAAVKAIKASPSSSVREAFGVAICAMLDKP